MNPPRAKRILISVCFAACVSLGQVACSTPTPYRAGEAQFASLKQAAGQEYPTPTRAELQEEVLRYETRFSARVNDAFRPLDSASSNWIRRQSTNQKLLYSSSALDIALGPVPEKNLLDMIVFTELVADVFRDYWIPRFYAAAGKPVLDAMRQSSDDLARASGPYLTPSQIAEVRALVDNWHRNHMDVISVESVRLSDFSVEAGAKEKQLEGNISGILGPVVAATIEANRAISLGERGLHYATRAPTLLRMQGLVGVQDALGELENTGELNGVLEQSRALLGELVRSEPLLETLTSVLRHLNDILMSKETGPALSRILNGFILELFLLGIAFVLFTGAVYVLAKLTYERFSMKRRISIDQSDRKKAA